MKSMFPGITHVTLTQKADGQTRVVSCASLRKKLSKKKFKQVDSDMFLFGEWENEKYSMKIHTQPKDYLGKDCFG